MIYAVAERLMPPRERLQTVREKQAQDTRDRACRQLAFVLLFVIKWNGAEEAQLVLVHRHDLRAIEQRLYERQRSGAHVRRVRWRQRERRCGHPDEDAFPRNIKQNWNIAQYSDIDCTIVYRNYVYLAIYLPCRLHSIH